MPSFMSTIFSLKKSAAYLVILVTTVILTGCGDLGYYLQCVTGHMAVMSNTRPINTLINDPETRPELRQQLEKVQAMRSFAVTELGLPDNNSYRRYADIGRPYVVWNLVASGEFSFQPKQWCFPVAGCVSYKGFFKQSEAEKLVAELRSQNLDVDLYGVEAYSTLNWFPDPVLNTFISSSETRLAGLLFHELAHQRVYVADDSAFNEAFAMTVQIEGVRRWLKQNARPEEWQRYLDQQTQGELFQEYLKTTREQLEQLYHQQLPEQEKRAEKQRLFAAALENFEKLKQSGQLDNRFDRWMAQGLNNARLAGIATYREFIPAFQTLLQQCGGKLDCFYAEVDKLGKLPHAERLAKLKSFSQPVLTAHDDS